LFCNNQKLITIIFYNSLNLFANIYNVTNSYIDIQLCTVISNQSINLWVTCKWNL